MPQIVQSSLRYHRHKSLKRTFAGGENGIEKYLRGARHCLGDANQGNMRLECRIVNESARYPDPMTWPW